MPCEISGSCEMVCRATPTICGRMAAALANSIAAWRSAVLVMTLTWLAPSCLMALVTWRRRLTTFFFDLVDHARVAEMDLADVDGAELVAPFLGLRGNLGAHGLAHGVAVFEHLRQLHVAQAADGGVADVGGQGAARVGVLEEIGDGIADVHLVPDADAHRRAFLGVDRLAPKVLPGRAACPGCSNVPAKLTIKAPGPSSLGRKCNPVRRAGR